MKLRFTTKSFILSNILFIVFRTLQIILFTESGTKFLKPQFLVLNIVLTVICLIPVVYTAANTFYAFRLPYRVGKTGIPGFVFCLAAGVLCVIPLLSSVLSGDMGEGVASLFSILLTLSGAVACILFAISEITRFNVPKPTALLLVAMWMYEFITAYTYYTGHPLRVHTVYEIFAIILTVFFFLSLSKAHSGVSPEKNFRFMYSLGFTASTFCYIAVIPELIAAISGFSDNVTAPCVPWAALLGAGIFMTYITLATNTYSNTQRKMPHS